MSGAAEQTNFPTMIIPRGTEIKVNAQGQLSIRTPGNLVIQNSGVFSEIESTNGSIRIDENVTVEAVSIRAGQACFIQGTVTAWRVSAKRIALEDRARAFIMLQESEQLEMARSARLVGNFANEKELFLMMGKFTGQLKELPGGVDMTSPTMMDRPVVQAAIAAPAPPVATAPPAAPAPSPVSAAPAPQVTPPPQPPSAEHLRQAQALIEHEVARPGLPQAQVDSLSELIYALREQNVSRVGTIFRTAFAEIEAPSEQLRQAYWHLERAFQQTHG